VRYLILSDIHANLEALEAVLAHAEGSFDRILCCGDIVGYAADPNAVVDWVRTNAQVVIRGNHDKAAAGSEDLEWFNSAARAATLWTQQTLTPENLEYLRGLPRGPALVGDFQLVHGSPLDEDEYLVSPRDAAQLTGYLETPVTFFGHTHYQGGFLIQRNDTRRIHALLPMEDSMEFSIPNGTAALINPGSVGQPRDGDPRAAYALYMPEQRLVYYRRVPYDIERAQRKILEAGLPQQLAFRLATGS